jgi:uncharacterized membrane protein YqgA involved in biofilm formation
MLGTIVNAAAIIAGSFAGMLLRGGVPERVNETIMKGIGLCVLLIGISSALKVDNTIVIIFSMVIGGVVGELIDIDKRLKKLGDRIEAKLKGKGGKVSEGFVTATLVFCIGAMAIVGSLESGITGNHQTLFAKSVLDGISSIVFASSLGIGVALSAVSVFVYQGIITLAASSLQGILVGSVISNMTAAGGLMIVAIALNMLGITKIKVANLLPGIFIPILYYLAQPGIKGLASMLGM